MIVDAFESLYTIKSIKPLQDNIERASKPRHDLDGDEKERQEDMDDD